MVMLYGKAMHDFVLTEIELGHRVANALDDETYGYGPLFDLQYELYLARHEPQAPRGPSWPLVRRLLEDASHP